MAFFTFYCCLHRIVTYNMYSLQLLCHSYLDSGSLYYAPGSAMAKVKSAKKSAKSVASGSTPKDEVEPQTMWQNASPPSPSYSHGSADSFQLVDAGASTKFIVDTGASTKFIARDPTANQITEQRQSDREVELLQNIVELQRKAGGKAYRKWYDYHFSKDEEAVRLRALRDTSKDPPIFANDDQPNLFPFLVEDAEMENRLRELYHMQNQEEEPADIQDRKHFTEAFVPL